MCTLASCGVPVYGSMALVRFPISLTKCPLVQPPPALTNSLKGGWADGQLPTSVLFARRQMKGWFISSVLACSGMLSVDNSHMFQTCFPVSIFANFLAFCEGFFLCMFLFPKFFHPLRLTAFCMNLRFIVMIGFMTFVHVQQKIKMLIYLFIYLECHSKMISCWDQSAWLWFTFVSNTLQWNFRIGV